MLFKTRTGNDKEDKRFIVHVFNVLLFKNAVPTDLILEKFPHNGQDERLEIITEQLK